MLMRRTLGSLLLTLLLLASVTGCGSDDSGAAQRTDPTPTEPSSTSPTSGAVDFDLVAIVSQTAAGGRVSLGPTPLPDKAAVTRFARQFRTEALGNRLADEVAKADVPAGRTLVAAVVSIGCDVPPGVDVTAAGNGLEITPQAVPSPLPECLAAVTAVALVAVPSDAV